ncbi:hypothetical protein CPB85DRAFT_1265386 [Mucidula mucida]|nr:hypothetical protein CPB85DRAFT_1265386 [Mucidula mucida]
MAWRRRARMRPRVPDPPSRNSVPLDPVPALRRIFISIPVNSSCDCRRLSQKALDLVPDNSTYSTSDTWSDEDRYRLAVIEHVYRKIKPHHASSRYRSKFSKLFRNYTTCCYRASAAMEVMLSGIQITSDATRIAPSDHFPTSTPPSTSSPHSHTSPRHLRLEYARVVASWMATVMQSLPMVSNFSGIPQALAWLAEGKRVRTVEMLQDIKSWILSYDVPNRDMLSPQILSRLNDLQQIIHTVELRSPISRFLLAEQDQQLLADGAVQLERATLVQILSEMIYIRRILFSLSAMAFFPMTEACQHGCLRGCMVLQWRLACMLHSHHQCDAEVRTPWTEMSFPTSSGPGPTGPSTRKAVVEESCWTGLLCVDEKC